MDKTPDLECFFERENDKDIDPDLDKFLQKDRRHLFLPEKELQNIKSSSPRHDLCLDIKT